MDQGGAHIARGVPCYVLHRVGCEDSNESCFGIISNIQVWNMHQMWVIIRKGKIVGLEKSL